MLPLLLVLIVAVFLPPMHMATTVEAEAGELKKAPRFS